MKKILLILILSLLLTASAEAQTKTKDKKTGAIKKTAAAAAAKAKPAADKSAKAAASPAVAEEKKPKTEEKPKAQDIEFAGMVEVNAVKGSEPQGLSVWTIFPIVKDENSRKLLKSSHQMMKIKGQLIEERPGKFSIKIKSAESIEEAPLDL
jgi:hypothetical protein